MRYLIILLLVFSAVVFHFFYRTSGVQMPEDEIALGKTLFSDPLLSSDKKISCASCHKPSFAFADTSAVSLGVLNRKGVRNTPSAMNVNNAAFFFWDGRASTLEEQALIPIANPDEMNLPVDSAVHRLQQSGFYREAFQKIYQQQPSAKTLSRALAAFEQSLETGDTPFDNWKTNDNEKAVSESVKRGFALFNGSANCVRCHFGPDFSNTEFRNIGLFNGKDLNDSGRAVITRKANDLGKFKIGPLRNVALTAPYMHNGMFKTLREVIDYYNDPDKIVPDAINRDSLLSKPLNLSEPDKQDLENFLKSLTSKSLARK
ncbi:cytochrome-c peroxidase [Leadbetterella sp. DM7]|uniref:cytochrome-c peroxidase n=1 Tax=Leadbetterella sp. DM7 TaxID=3235085 RepID=UPI00349E9024